MDAEPSAGVPWASLRVGVVGLGVAGVPAAEALLGRGARVVAFDRGTDAAVEERARGLADRGAEIHLGVLPDPVGLDLLVVSPGVPPRAPELVRALEVEVPIWGELELAWRLRGAGSAPWLTISGTNGKTTTTLMLAAMLRADGRSTAAIGNIGFSAVAAVDSGVHYDTLAVEVSASQLPFVYSIAPLAAACLNVAPDHVDFFGSFGAYRGAKARVFDRTRVAAVFNADDPVTGEMVAGADLAPDCRRVGFTLGEPTGGMLGVSGGDIVDLAFGSGPVAPVADVRPAAPHNVENALAAAALALAAGVAPGAVRQGLATFQPAAHRIADAGRIGNVAFVDDSKATNGHAAQKSLLAYTAVVWVAGGLAKGQEFDDLVKAARSRLRGVVLIGKDRDVIARALDRHAPEVPVVEVETTDTGAMGEAVGAALELARRGDTVLLAPGCASWDMFTDYADRGRSFVAAVAARTAGEPGTPVPGGEQ